MFFIFANSTGPGEMPHYAAFHPGLHCLPKYLKMLNDTRYVYCKSGVQIINANLLQVFFMFKF